VAPSPAPLDTPGAQGRFFEAVAGVLVTAFAGAPAGVVFVDDVHWADEASVDLLTYVVRRLGDRPLCVLLAWRAEEVPPGHRLRRLVTEMERAGRGTAVRLGPLTKGDVEQLSKAADPGAEPGLGERLFEKTQGVPLFLVEYLTALAEGREASAPSRSVRELLHARLAATSEVGRQVVAAAAVIGRPFDLDTVRETSGRSDEETVAALEELTAKRLLAETASGYEFAHDETRALVYDETSLARRRLLHRRVADALARGAHATADAGPVASVVARHYLLAGDERDAAEYFKLAGEHARRLYANAEALSHLQAALTLGHPDAASLHESIGDLHTLGGDYRAAVTSYETAAAQDDSADLAVLEHKLGTVHDRRGEWDLADSHFAAALEALADGGAARARILADRSLSAHRRGDDAEALELAEEAVAVADAAGDPRALAQAHNILGVLAKARGRVGDAREHLERSLALAETVDDAGARIAALNNLALAHGASGEFDRALELLDTALVLCASQGDRHREAALRNNVADLLHSAGRSQEAMKHLKQAVAIFAEVGEPDTMQPEIWKLVEW
jgi:predicted ATPase